MAFTTAIFLMASFTGIYGTPIESRIVNGTNAVDGEFPYAVSVRHYNSHSCGGSIFSDSWVITAAHCVDGSTPSHLSILFGTVDLQNGDSELVRSVKTIKMHENYEPWNNYANDIALIELEQPIPFSENAQPVKLPESNAPTPGGSPAVLVGWGYQKSGGSVMTILQKVDLIIYSETDCSNAHGSNVNPEVQLCAGVPEGGKGQCSGDSGGPLTVSGVQFGVVSWSVKPCAIKGYPGVFARVSTYIDWMNSAMSSGK